MKMRSYYLYWDGGSFWHHKCRCIFHCQAHHYLAGASFLLTFIVFFPITMNPLTPPAPQYHHTVVHVNESFFSQHILIGTINTKIISLILLVLIPGSSRSLLIIYVCGFMHRPATRREIKYQRIQVSGLIQIITK